MSVTYFKCLSDSYSLLGQGTDGENSNTYGIFSGESGFDKDKMLTKVWRNLKTVDALGLKTFELGETALTVTYERKDDKNTDFIIEQTDNLIPTIMATTTEFESSAEKSPAVVTLKLANSSIQTENKTTVTFKKFSDAVTFKNITPWTKQAGKVEIEKYI